MDVSDLLWCPIETMISVKADWAELSLPLAVPLATTIARMLDSPAIMVSVQFPDLRLRT